MNTYTLNINTFGICTHFTRGVISGVPHRIVLPVATPIQAHTVAVPDQPPVLYYLIPHFPRIEFSDGSEPTIPGLLQRGDFLTGARLQVLNCIDERMIYRGSGAPSLADYDPDYMFSDDVVLHGRAACYFDVYGGTFSYSALPNGGAGWVQITMQTNGPPVLLVTPITQGSSLSGTSSRLIFGETAVPSEPLTLTLKNVELLRELRADQRLGSFDFLLHYITARGGIPESLAKRTPGMPKSLISVSRERLSEALAELAEMVAPPPPGMRRELMPEGDLTSSCAPSQWP